MSCIDAWLRIEDAKCCPEECAPRKKRVCRAACVCAELCARGLCVMSFQDQSSQLFGALRDEIREPHTKCHPCPDAAPLALPCLHLPRCSVAYAHAHLSSEV